MSQSLALLPVAVLACAVICAALIGCGSSSPKGASSSAKASTNTNTNTSASAPVGTQTPASPELVDAALAQIKSPDEVIVRIGAHQITKHELYRWMSFSPTGRLEVPEPPEFKHCIINLRKPEQSSTGERRAANDLKEICAKRFSEELQTGLGTLVNNAWLMYELSEEGTPIDRAEVQKTYRASLAQIAKLPGGVAGLLKRTGHTLADLKYELTATQASDQVYAMIAAKTPKLTPARLARYYRQHKGEYLIPEQRDLYILHTKSKAAAQRAKEEIKAGKSFAEVVAKNLKDVSQPLGTKEGRDRTLNRKSYAQHNLINAIFNAPPGVLSGPFEVHYNATRYLALGFYVFEVLRKIPAHQMSLAETKPQIEQQAAQALRNEARKDFVAAYKAKWKARTDCAPEYVIENCRQYKGQPFESADPYVL